MNIPRTLIFVLALLAGGALTGIANAETKPVEMQPGVQEHPMKRLWRGIDQLNFDIEQVHILSSYCKPPEEPNKADTDFEIGWLWLDFRRLQDSYRAMEAAYKASFQTRLGASYRGGFPSLDGIGAGDRDYWARTHQMLARVEGALRAKDERLQRAPERDCGKKAKQTETRIGDDVKPDPMSGLTRPVIDALVVPAIPAFFCSDLERRQWLIANFNPVYLKAAENAQAAASYRADVARRANAHLQADGDKPTQARLNAEERWADELYKEHSAMIDKTERIRRQILSTPIIDCSKKTSDAAAVGQEVLTQPVYESVLDPAIPARFCTAEEKAAAEAAVKAASDAAWRNYAKAGAKLVEVADLIGKGKNSPAVQAAFDEANAATKQWYERGQQLDALLQRVRQMPVQPCAEPGKQTGMVPSTGNATFVAVAPALTFGAWEGPRPVYLGFENALLVQRFHVEDIETDDKFTGFDFHVAANINDRLALHVGVNTYGLSFSGARETIDPLGQDLLFPGVTSAGYALGAGVPEGTPGGFNVVDRLSYSYRADNTTLYAALAHAYDCGPVNLIGYGGIAHTFGDQHQRLEGDIPGYGFGFAYDTEFRTEVTRGMIGGRATTAPFAGMPQFRVNAGLTAFLNFADTEGVDELQLGGIFEQLDLGKNEVTFGWAAGVGAEWEIGATTLFANYRYMDDDVVPIAVREDNATNSHAEFERAQAHVGMLGARLSF